MNPGISDDHPSIHYYDADYPSPLTTPYPENLDDVLAYQGLLHDLDRFRELATAATGPILELCCGTGRVSIALASSDHDVVAVDISPGMLARFRHNLRQQPEEVRERITLIQQDITTLSLERNDFSLIVCAFNSLLCVPSFEGQRAAIRSAAAHLAPSGRLVLDVVNPLRLKLEGDSTPRPFYTRRNPHTGNAYTRFYMFGPMDDEQRQSLLGWYDELDEQGRVVRSPYQMKWRPIFRYELELMLEAAGLRIVSLEGGHQKEPFKVESPRMFAVCAKA